MGTRQVYTSTPSSQALRVWSLRATKATVSLVALDGLSSTVDSKCFLNL